MKQRITKTVATVIAALALIAGFAANAQNEKGAERLFSKPLRTAADVQTVKPGDQVAMACPKCKTVTVTRVAEGRNPARATQKVAKHDCPACKNTFEVSQTGRSSSEQVVHKCSHCGSTDAFCTLLEKGKK
ncbi:MAG: hypothetical protein ACK4UN_11120 [Limisphaerales bacterium]